MSALFDLDTNVFLLMNHLPHNQVTDLIGQMISGAGMVGAVWLAIGIFVYLIEANKDHWFAGRLLVAGVASWLVVEEIIKPLVARLRPSAEMGAVIVGKISTDYSFPSGHATIAWAMATVLAAKKPDGKPLYYILALAISLSRIYLGKHYPLDVVAGGIIGWGIGVLIEKLSPRLKRNKPSSSDISSTS